METKRVRLPKGIRIYKGTKGYPKDMKIHIPKNKEAVCQDKIVDDIQYLDEITGSCDKLEGGGSISVEDGGLGAITRGFKFL